MELKTDLYINYEKFIHDINNAIYKPNPISKKLATKDPEINILYKLFNKRKEYAIILKQVIINENKIEAVNQFSMINDDIKRIMGLESITK